MKPIEPGCLCIVVGGEVNWLGKTVEVQCWAVEGDLIHDHERMPATALGTGWVAFLVGDDEGCGIFCNHELRRIDDHEKDQHDEATRVEEITGVPVICL